MTKPIFYYEIYRDLGDNGKEAITEWDGDATYFVQAGLETWEAAERCLVEHYKPEWGTGTFVFEVTSSQDQRQITRLERQLPMPDAYLALPRIGGSDKPNRAFAHTLVAEYPGASLELVSRHIVDFRDHFHGEIGTEELLDRTGFEAEAAPFVVRGTRTNPGLVPSQLSQRRSDLSQAVAAGLEYMAEGWTDVRIAHQGRVLLSAGDMQAIATRGKMVMIQPERQPDLHLPYPYYIKPDGSVHRQDFWKGNPAALVGFQDQADVQRVNLTREVFRANPHSAIGKFPIFVDDQGGMWNSEIPISGVHILPAPAEDEESS